MGLIETTISAASSSSRRGIFSCDALSDSVLLAVGRRPAEPSGGNLLDHGGKLKVSEGQCALLVSRGKVTDFCAYVTPELCTNCGACVEACPQHCITYFK